jgi:hypothetical protein
LTSPSASGRGSRPLDSLDSKDRLSRCVAPSALLLSTTSNRPQNMSRNGSVARVLVSKLSSNPSRVVYALPECHMPRSLQVRRWSLKISGYGSKLPQVKAQASLRTRKARPRSALPPSFGEACFATCTGRCCDRPVPQTHFFSLRRAHDPKAESSKIFVPVRRIGARMRSPRSRRRISAHNRVEFRRRLTFLSPLAIKKGLR